MNNSFLDKPRMLSSEAAVQLGISLRTLYRLLEAGILTEPHDYVVMTGKRRTRFWSDSEVETARKALIERATAPYLEW